MTHFFKRYVFFLFLSLSTMAFAQDQDLQSKVEYRITVLRQELNLTEAQAVALRPIINEFVAKRGELIQGTEGQGIIDHVAVKDSLKELKKDEYQKMSKILTESQMSKWVQKENLRASLNPDGDESQVDDGPGLAPSGANFKF